MKTVAECAELLEGLSGEPHQFLGLHPEGNEKVIRLFRPGATELSIELHGQLVPLTKVHEKGLFERRVLASTTAQDYRIFHQNGLLAHDPYAFSPTLGPLDTYLFSRGVHYEIYKVLGAHLHTVDGVEGVRFCLWAPNARRVSLIADFNFWNGWANPLRNFSHSGIWELFVPGLGIGERYKFEIVTQTHQLLIKADPYAHASEMRPKTASVTAHVDRYAWRDSAWMEERVRGRGEPKPLNIYEVHLGSWKWKQGRPLNYRESAFELARYCKEMGYTHVELLPISEHPFDESWGYQVTGFYAATSRYGTPEDFQYFVDTFHAMGLGVIVDWVPGHFPHDAFSLSQFDGTALYEHEDPRLGFHPHWKTAIFNYGRYEVSNFLIGSALFWLDKMHVDGLRVDAVASMLYLDYGRESGEWIPNRYGGRENLEAIEFLKHLNSVVHERFPGVLMIAEESTSFPKITTPVKEDGLGFDLKWNMGWMNDTLRYFHRDPLYRSYHQNDITFGLLYAFSEKFALVLSHDEVVHGKGSLLNKMPGDEWQRFANLRLLLSYLICQPGKKMLFMGGEIGQGNEWWCKEELHWHLLEYPFHQGVQRMVKELNHLYLENRALWERDFSYDGFDWVAFSDVQGSVISYKRKAVTQELLCVHNFTPNSYPSYLLPLPHGVKLHEIFNSDALRYGGSGHVSAPPEGSSEGMRISVAPLATQIFTLQY